MRRPTRRTAAFAIAAGVASPALAAARPRRIVSLNPCLDAILVHLADRSQIAAVSHYARDPLGSSIEPIARTLPITYESAEEVVALRPDLVLMTRHSAPATRNALKRMDIKVELFAVPDKVEESLEQVEAVAALIGQPQRGAALVARIRAAVAAAAPHPGERRLTALVYQSNGFASAEGTLMDDMLRRCGLTNAAAGYGLKRTGNVPLELVVARPPDLLLAGAPKPGAPTWADRVLAHPALRTVQGRTHRAVFPQRLMFCGGPVLVETAAMLARARRQAQGLTP